MASFTIQFPVSNAASHGILIPFFGITNTSPGTRSSDDKSSITKQIKKSMYCLHMPAVKYLPLPPRKTLTLEEWYTIS